MPIDSRTIDRIVAGVLQQLSTNGNGAAVGVAAETRRRGGHTEESLSREATPGAGGARHTVRADQTVLRANVVTADVLLSAVTGGSRIVVSDQAIITPAAWDAAREHAIEIARQSPRATPRGYTSAGDESSNQREQTVGPDGARQVGLGPLLIVVKSTDAVARLRDDLRGRWRRELLGWVDDAAALAVSAICRGETATVVVFAEQTHRAACLVNRNERVKGVAIADARDVRAVRMQLRANVWCVDPAGRSWFELRNVLRTISDA
jgi:hypothetical protein